MSAWQRPAAPERGGRRVGERTHMGLAKLSQKRGAAVEQPDWPTSKGQTGPSPLVSLFEKRQVSRQGQTGRKAGAQSHGSKVRCGRAMIARLPKDTLAAVAGKAPEASVYRPDRPLSHWESL